MTFVIEDNVPVPPSRTRGGVSKYPFPEMKIGDSFWACQTPSNLRSCAMMYGKRHNKKFVARSEMNADVKGIRIWRVE